MVSAIKSLCRHLVAQLRQHSVCPQTAVYTSAWTSGLLSYRSIYVVCLYLENIYIFIYILFNDLDNLLLRRTCHISFNNSGKNSKPYFLSDNYLFLGYYTNSLAPQKKYFVVMTVLINIIDEVISQRKNND